jgi:hypothetical protein
MPGKREQIQVTDKERKIEEMLLMDAQYRRVIGDAITKADELLTLCS